MGAVGIIAEYDPFHTGHAYHIAETRRMLGEDRPVVCVMSGNWVQRGACAVIDKWTRAAMALDGGADLVLELPTVWAASSAESFARGAVGHLLATGVVDAFSFGSESGRLEDLRAVAGAVDTENFRSALRAELDRGTSFALARQRAALAAAGKAGGLLQGPNDSLGVEYLRAVGPGMAAIAVKRRGAAHGGGAEEGFASASCLREKLRQGEDVSSWLTEGNAALLRGAELADISHIQRAVLARLRQMGEADFAALPDSGETEGLPARLVRAAAGAGSLEEFYALAKTRRYAHARIRRLALWAFLGLTAAHRPERPLYLRVLGFNDRGREVLRDMKTRASLPVLTKSAHVRNLGGEARALFALEERSTDLYGLCFPTPRRSGEEWRRGPAVR